MPTARARTPARSCLDSAATIRRARLDARHPIFAEQQTVIAQRDGRILVAGNPVYVWRDRGDHYELLARDSLFGIVIDSTPFVHAVPSPLPGRVLDGMRAAALPDGWWMVAFAQVTSGDPSKPAETLSMWVGETDGARWRKVQRLPGPADSLGILRASALVWHEGRARMVVPIAKDRGSHVRVYALDHGRWTSYAAAFESPTSYVALRLTPTRDVLAVVRPVVDAIPDKNSLFLYSKAPADTLWTPRQLIMRAGLEPIRDPLFADDDSDVLSWRKSREGEREYDLWHAAYDARRDTVMTTPTLLTERAIEIKLAANHGHTLWVVSDRASSNPQLQLLEYDGTSVTRLTRASRYRGLLGLAFTPGRAVVIAAESAPTPRDPGVVSLIETHTWRCLERSRFP